jgi:hypothetical protein
MAQSPSKILGLGGLDTQHPAKFWVISNTDSKVFYDYRQLTLQQALELITPQEAPAMRRPISKFSYIKFEKVKSFNS